MERCWDHYWMGHVKLAQGMSTCVTRRVGAVLVRDRRLVAEGFNGNLPGHVHCDRGGCDRCNGDWVSGTGLERCVCVHAEQNIVSYCAREGVAMSGTTLYLACTPCLDCFKLVAASGVQEIVYDEFYPSAEEVVSALAIPSRIRLRRTKCVCSMQLPI